MKTFIKKNLFGLWMIMWSVLNFGLFFLNYANLGVTNDNFMNGYQIISFIGDNSRLLNDAAIVQIIFISINFIMLIYGLLSLVKKFRKDILINNTISFVLGVLSIFAVIYLPLQTSKNYFGFPQSVTGEFIIILSLNILSSIAIILLSRISFRKK